MNLTIVNFALVSSFRQSPLVTSSRSLVIQFSNLHLSKIAHPVFFSSVPQTVFIQSLRLSYCLSSAIVCAKIPENPENPVKTGSYYGEDMKISWTYSNAGLNFLSGNITLSNCTFYECKGPSTFSLRQSALYCRGTTFSKCDRLFDIDSPVNGSYLIDCQVTDMSSNVVYLKDGSFAISNTTFTQNANLDNENSLLCFVQGDQIKINRCTFSTSKATVLSILSTGTNTLSITECSFNVKRETKSVKIEKTYTVISYTCATEPDFLDGDNLSPVKGDTANNFNMSACPFTETSTPLSEEKRAFAIATTVVFFAAFAILFIVLIVFVFIKKEAEKEEQYKSLNEVENQQNSDDDIPSG